MAVPTSGNKILSSEIRGWYTALNTIITNFGPGTSTISTLTLPAAESSALASNINDYVAKTNQLANDEYLKYAPYPQYSVVSQGNLISVTDGKQLDEIVDSSHLGVVKCRNKATNNFGTCQNLNHQNGKYTTNGTKSNAEYDSGNHNVSHNFQSKYNGYVWGFSGFGTFGSFNNGVKDNSPKSNGVNTNGSAVDLRNVKTVAGNSNGTCTQGTNTHGTNEHGTKSNSEYDSGNHNVNHNFQSKYNGYVWGFSGFGTFGTYQNGPCQNTPCQYGTNSYTP